MYLPCGYDTSSNPSVLYVWNLNMRIWHKGGSKNCLTTSLLDEFSDKLNDFAREPVTSPTLLVYAQYCETVNSAIARISYYDLSGRRSTSPWNGVNLRITTYTDGSKLALLNQFVLGDSMTKPGGIKTSRSPSHERPGLLLFKLQ